ncbi:MAG: signal recognition particle-docking protein FtsY [Clostridia bacterium]|nr:signal recognition particle-docking protein FtsY [Clostridia bacterium]
MGFFEKLKQGLSKTKNAFNDRVNEVMANFRKVDEDLMEALEEALILSDVGVETSSKIIENLRNRVKLQKIEDADKVKEALVDEIAKVLTKNDTSINLETKPSIIMMVGVNGAGKTTSIGKIAHSLKAEGKKVMVVAADTFRAAAIEQLEVWAQRAEVEFFRKNEGSDPASVVFDGIKKAKEENYDVVIVDTAGRLHTKKNLMDELGKIQRIVDRELENASKEILLVLDGTTGQNMISQAKQFSEVTNITGLVLTKIDGTAKGGAVIGICSEMNIPIKYIGVGEKIDDLQKFDATDFAKALFEE